MCILQGARSFLLISKPVSPLPTLVLTVEQVEGSDLASSMPIAYELLCGGSSTRDDDGGACVVPSEEAEGECARRRALVDADPVATLRLAAWAQQQLETAAGVHGGGAVTAALNAVDPTLAGQLRAMLDSAAAPPPPQQQ